jgi:2-hydroxychromene-2-carboxylate isomerase
MQAAALAIGLGLSALAAKAPEAAAQKAGSTRWERPPEGTLHRGLFGVPAWVVLVTGGLVAAGAALALLASARRGGRPKRR